MAGGGHDRERGGEHVEVAVEVHGEHRCASPPRVPSAKLVGRVMPGHVDHRVEPAELLEQVARPRRPSVTETDVARADPPAATMRPAVVSSGGGSGSLPSSVTSGSIVTTKAPWRPSSSAMAAPIPPPPPVTATTRCPSVAVGGHGAATWSSSSKPSQSPLRQPLLQQRRGTRSSRRSRGRSCRCAGFSEPGLPSWLIRDGVQADITALPSTNESTIFWVQASSASALTSNTFTPALLEDADGAADELGAEHRQLRVVDGHDALLGGRRHHEQVREAAAHHPEEAWRGPAPTSRPG